MKEFIKQFIKYPVLGNVIVFTVLIFGFFGLRSLKTTFFPQIPSKFIVIQAVYPGASPQEVEEGIVLKIEDNLKGLTGIDRVTSTSSENLGTITVELHTGYPIDVALQDVKNAVDKISYFPVGMEPPVIFKREMMDFAVNFAVHGNVDLRVLKKHARKIERELRNVDGISKITLKGFPKEEIEIGFREDALRRYNMSFTEVSNAIRKTNIRVTGGRIKGSKEELLIRASSKGYYADELKNIVIRASAEGAIIRLKDVAELRDRWEDRPDRVYFNGKPAVSIDVNTTNEEDLFFVSDYVLKYIKKYNVTHNETQISVLRDGSKIIQERINILTNNGIWGIILVMIFLTLFLNARLSIWVSLGIPIAFAGMFALGPLFGITINVMSLMAMILVVGMLVDDGIVVAENIYQHYENGKKPFLAAVDGTLEVLPSVLSAVLTTVVIFSTFFFLEGGMGDRTRDLAYVVIAALIFSLVEATFILPAHVGHSKALKIEPEKKNWFETKTENFLFWIRDRIYAPLLRFNIKHTAIALAIPVALLIITIGALKGSLVKTTFFPNIEMDNVKVSLQMPAGTSTAVTNGHLRTIEKAVWTVNEDYRKTHKSASALITSVVRNIGPGTNTGSVTANFVSVDKRDWPSLKIVDKVRKKTGAIPNAVNLEFGGGSHWGKPVSIAITGDNLQEVRGAKDMLKRELRNISVIKDVVDNDPPGLREVTIDLKEKALALGITPKDVMDQVRAGFFGAEAQRIQRGIDEVRIWVRYTIDQRATLSQLKQMRIRLPNNREYPLNEIADLTIKRGITTINHVNTQRTIKVEADISNPKESVTDLLANIEANILPSLKEQYPDIHFAFEGQSRESAKTAKSARAVIPPVLLLMFIIVVITFRSFSQAFIVYLTIPFGIIGVIWGHFIQGYIVSVLSMFGMIALMGIMVNDSLVLINAMNQLLKQGLPFREALYKAAVSRFRPVLLTSLTTIAGLGPLIFETSFHAQFLAPMAISLAYGLLFATMLTLLMIPALLMILNHIKVFIYGLFSKEQMQPRDVEPAVREDLFIKGL